MSAVGGALPHRHGTSRMQASNIQTDTFTDGTQSTQYDNRSGINSSSEQETNRDNATITEFLLSDDKARSRMALEYIVADLVSFDTYRKKLISFELELLKEPHKAAVFLSRRASPLHRSYNHMSNLPVHHESTSRLDELLFTIAKFSQASDSILGFLDFVNGSFGSPLRCMSLVKQSVMQANERLGKLISFVKRSLSVDGLVMDAWLCYGIEIKDIPSDELSRDEKTGMLDASSVHHPLKRCLGTKWNKFLTMDCGGIEKCSGERTFVTEASTGRMMMPPTSILIPSAANLIDWRSGSASLHFMDFFEENGQYTEKITDEQEAARSEMAQRAVGYQFNEAYMPPFCDYIMPGLTGELSRRPVHDRSGNQTFDYMSDYIEKSLNAMGREIEIREVKQHQLGRLVQF